jgi:hypothetical protein
MAAIVSELGSGLLNQLALGIIFEKLLRDLKAEA